MENLNVNFEDVYDLIIRAKYTDKEGCKFEKFNDDLEYITDFAQYKRLQNFAFSFDINEDIHLTKEFAEFLNNKMEQLIIKIENIEVEPRDLSMDYIIDFNYWVNDGQVKKRCY